MHAKTSYRMKSGSRLPLDNRLKLTSGCLLVLLSCSAAAPERLHYRIDPPASAAQAKVAFLGIAGKTAHFENISGTVSLKPGNLQSLDIDVTIDAATLSATDSFTEKRLKGPDFFDVSRYPTVTFSAERLVMADKTSGKLIGRLTARGITRPVTLAVRFSIPPASARGGERFQMSGITVIDRRDFGMKAYALIVGRSVKISINASLTGRDG